MLRPASQPELSKVAGPSLPDFPERVGGGGAGEGAAIAAGVGVLLTGVARTWTAGASVPCCERPPPAVRIRPGAVPCAPATAAAATAAPSAGIRRRPTDSGIEATGVPGAPGAEVVPRGPGLAARPTR